MALAPGIGCTRYGGYQRIVAKMTQNRGPSPKPGHSAPDSGLILCRTKTHSKAEVTDDVALGTSILHRRSDRGVAGIYGNCDSGCRYSQDSVLPVLDIVPGDLDGALVASIVIDSGGCNLLALLKGTSKT